MVIGKSEDTTQPATPAQPLSMPYATRVNLSRYIGAAALCVVVAVFIVGLIYRVSLTSTISNLDYFPLVDRALRLNATLSPDWVNWQHPVGFPWLIRAGLALGVDAERIGQALSLLGGALGLIGAYLLGRTVFRERYLALASVVLVAATGSYLTLSSYEGNDMLAAGLQTLALGILVAANTNRRRVPAIALAGLINGFAYLIRYTGMVTLLVNTLWLIGIAIMDRAIMDRAIPGGAAPVQGRDRGAWLAVAAYVGAFLIGSALQWIPSLIMTGSPFYIDQGKNVLFHIYGESDFIQRWRELPDNISVAQVFLMEPARFIEHWWTTFRSFWSDFGVLDAPIKMLGNAGLIALLFAKDESPRRIRVLLILFVLAHVASLSMLRLDTRFMMVLLPVLVVSALFLLKVLIPARVHVSRYAIPMRELVIGGAVALSLLTPINFVAARPGPVEYVLEASDALHAAGMRSADEVLSTHLWLQDASAITRQRFPQAYWVAPDQTSIERLAQTMWAQGRKFFIYDKDTGPIAYRQLDANALLSPEKNQSLFTPVYLSKDRAFVIYRLNDPSLNKCVPVQATFANGISLTCYELQVSRDAWPKSQTRLGVYLHWQTDRKLDDSWKAFLHLMDSNGQLVAQVDGVPVLWTYPTTAWNKGEAVIDFHHFPLLDQPVLSQAPLTLRVGLYNEKTGERLPITRASNDVADNSVMLASAVLTQGPLLK